jgi:hypothetical protein
MARREFGRCAAHQIVALEEALLSLYSLRGSGAPGSGALSGVGCRRQRSLLESKGLRLPNFEISGCAETSLTLEK